MGKRRQTLLYTLVFVTGFFGLVLANEMWPGKLPFLGRGLEAEVQADFRKTWLPLLKPDLRVSRVLDDHPEFFERWGAVRADRGQAHLDELRRRLHTYLDFVESEYADAADIFDAGQADVLSERARERRERMRADFPPIGDGPGLGEEIIRQYDEKVREAAYRASPEVAAGDPDQIDYRALNEHVRQWLVDARRIVDDVVRALD